MNLIDRIDIALRHARKSRGELAAAIGVSVQAISNLKRRPHGELRLVHTAHAARFLGVDLYWLCTGEGEFRRADALSFLAAEAARFIEEMPERERERAFALLYQMTRGNWPTYPPSPHAAARSVHQ